MPKSPARSSHRLEIPDLDGRHRIPVELWEQIFHKMADPELLTTAAVCTLFNQLCSRLHFLEDEVHFASALAGSYTVTPRLLPALQRSFYTPPIIRLACSFPDAEILQGLKILAVIVASAPSLQELDLGFPETALLPRENTSSKDRDFGMAFMNLMCAMGQKVDGPLIFVHHSTAICRPGKSSIFRIRGYEGSFCSFRLRLPSRKLPGRSKKMGTVEYISGPCVSEIGFSLCSVNMRFLRSGTGQAFTLVVAAPSRESFSLQKESGSSISDAEFSAVLPHLSFPNLSHVDINESGLDPSQLSAFLSRHPGIKEINHRPWTKRITSKPLIEPRVHLPALNGILSISQDLRHLPRLLNGIFLPETRSISVSLEYLPFPTFGDSSFATILPKICARAVEQGARLNVLIQHEKYYSPDVLYTPGRKELRVAENLTGVETVRVVAQTIEHARQFLPWLMCVPSGIEVSLLVQDGDGQSRTALRQEAAQRRGGPIVVL
ncbi:hypothetical protein B0H11DRAFT_2009094 [Mycena galericulata]|nr:hypothetical protein B0H11DRAFT_2009094 [Mycena galericulata]